MTRRRGRKRLRAAGLLGGAGVIGLVGYTVSGITWLLFAFLGLAVGALIAGASALNDASHGGAPTRRASARRRRSTAAPSGKTRTQRTKATATPTRKAPGTQSCSAACRTSKKPVRNSRGELTCDCACRGKHHGRYREGTRANVKATPIPAHVKKANRDHRREKARQRRETPRGYHR